MSDSKGFSCLNPFVFANSQHFPKAQRLLPAQSMCVGRGGREGEGEGEEGGEGKGEKGRGRGMWGEGKRRREGREGKWGEGKGEK